MWYDPYKRDGEERDVSGMAGRVVDRLDNGYRLCVQRDLKGFVGDRVRVGIPDTFKGLGKMVMEEEW